MTRSAPSSVGVPARPRPPPRRGASPARGGAPRPRAERRRRRAAGGGERRPRRRRRRARGAARRASSVGGALLVALELVEAGRGLGAVRHHVGERVRRTCGRARGADGGGARTSSSRCGIVGDRSTPRRSSCSTSASSACAARRRRARASANGAGRRARRRAAPMASSAGPSSAAYARVERLAVRGRVGEQVLLGFERDVLVGIVERGGVDLVDLEAQQVDLAGPGAGVAAERGELVVERRGPRHARRGSAPSASSAGAPANRSSAPRCTAGSSSDWCACWPCRSTSARAGSASSPTVASRPST